MAKVDKYWLYGIGAGLLVVGGLFAFGRKASSNKKCLDPEKEDPALAKEFKIRLLPDGKCNYRSAQITEEQFPYVIKKYGIKRVIRLNGDNSDAKHLIKHPVTNRAKEKAACEQNGCSYTFIDSHQGYVKGRGFTKSIEETSNILAQGNTLIHCAHGADRTGGMVGAYLKNGGYITDRDKLWEYTVALNGWDDMIKSGKFFGTGFDKYADGFYPIEDLKKSKWNKK